MEIVLFRFESHACIIADNRAIKEVKSGQAFHCSVIFIIYGEREKNARKREQIIANELLSIEITKMKNSFLYSTMHNPIRLEKNPRGPPLQFTMKLNCELSFYYDLCNAFSRNSQHETSHFKFFTIISIH